MCHGRLPDRHGLVSAAGRPGSLLQGEFQALRSSSRVSAGVSGAVRGRGLQLGDGSFGWTVSPHPSHLALLSWPCSSDPPRHPRRGHTTPACTYMLTLHTCTQTCTHASTPALHVCGAHTSTLRHMHTQEQPQEEVGTLLLIWRLYLTTVMSQGD